MKGGHKIAIDVRSLMEGRHSGVEEYTSQIIRAMLEVPGDNKYEVFYNAWSPVELPYLGEDIERAVFKYPNKLFNASQYVLNWPRWDGLITADCFFVPNARPLPVSARTPYVVTVHDLSFERFPEFYSRQRRLWHRYVQPRKLLRNADHIIAVSAAAARDVTDIYGLDAAKVTVIHSGTPDWKEPPSREEIDRVREKYGLPRRYVLFLGTFEPRKNIIGVVRSYTAIADSVEQDLVIAGSRGWLMGPIQAAVRQSSARARIKVMGFVEEEDKQCLYAGADLFVYPSFYEGFGFPPLEALLAGTPVVTSFNSSLPEVVGDWATLVDPANAAEIAVVLRELLNDLPEVTSQQREEIRNRYSWGNAARETIEVMESVLE
ncbi:MAG: glycosyltransferase family 1 protein [Candidatus Andersenbacteria bacterium]|nr:glycosyltransferase family 1 protein [bacterium]MDZ4225361.1 glycosyltransferase family 1 protein [Candidatus Andersenbacteria bacterium]